MLGKVEAEGEEVMEDETVGSITKATDVNLAKLWEMPRDREAWCATVHGVVKSQTWPGN